MAENLSNIELMSYTGKFDLEDRLVDFAVLIMSIAERLPKSYAGIHLAKQIIRSGTSPALHHGEAQAAVSRADFIHKMKIGLKELRETLICLKILIKKGLLNGAKVEEAKAENNELIAIFVKSIETAKRNIANHQGR